MRARYFYWIMILSIAFLMFGCEVFAARTVMGAVASVAPDGNYLRMDTDDGVLVVEPAGEAKITRGQIGMDLRSVKLNDLAPGDRLVVVVDQYGSATSIKAFFGIVKGNFGKLDGQKIYFSDGRTVPIHAQTQIVSSDGKPASLADIKKDSSLTCRINPITGKAWTVLVSSAPASAAKPVTSVLVKDNPEPKTLPVPSSAPVRPQIKSITFSAPSPLRSGNTITVDMTGTPGAKASLEIKNLVGVTAMKEISAGVYHIELTVPKDKVVVGAPLVGRLESNGLKAIPVQASRLITVESDNAPVVTIAKAEPADAPKPQQIKEKPEPAISVAKVEIQEVPKVAPQVIITAPQPLDKPVDQPKQNKNVTILTPVDGANIQRSITVKGKADPDEKLRVVVTYNNGLTGILKLAGEVASQLVAVGKNGEFTVGPFALEGPLATRGLEYTIKAYYPDRADHGTATVKVIGTRS